MLALACLAGLLSGCADRNGVSGVVFAMDTAMSLTVYGKNAEAALAECETEIKRLDMLFSATNPESDIARINSGAGGFVEVSQETADIVRQSVALSELTGGAFDITVYPLVLEWGFFSKDYKVPDGETISELLGEVGSSRIEVDGNRVKIEAGQKIELGAVAKGYLTDRISEILESHEIKRANISLGGNILVVGRRPDNNLWRIGLQDPSNPETHFGVLEAENTAAVTSGDYQRYFEEDGVRYHHIIDPSSGYPAASGIRSVMIVTDNGIEADAFSTAVFVMGRERATAFWREQGGFEMVLVENDGGVYVTDGIKDGFTLADNVAYTLHVLS